jgi:hypothetical protein
MTLHVRAEYGHAFWIAHAVKSSDKDVSSSGQIPSLACQSGRLGDRQPTGWHTVQLPRMQWSCAHTRPVLAEGAWPLLRTCPCPCLRVTILTTLVQVRYGSTWGTRRGGSGGTKGFLEFDGMRERCKGVCGGRCHRGVAGGDQECCGAGGGGGGDSAGPSTPGAPVRLRQPLELKMCRALAVPRCSCVYAWPPGCCPEAAVACSPGCRTATLSGLRLCSAYTA